MDRRRPDTTRINQGIRVREVRLIDPEGNQVGILPIHQALAQANDYGLDLVEISPNAKPPVCKIMDYGRYKYEQAKKARKARQASATTKIKTIKFRPKTDDHDYEFKKKHIISFLEAGNKVKIEMRFRGREISHLDLAMEFLKHLINEVDEWGTPETSPAREGRSITFVIAPKKVK